MAGSVTGWVTIVGDAAFTGGSAATSSPAVTGLGGDTIAAGFPTLTLADGESLTLSSSVTFNTVAFLMGSGISATSGTFSSITVTPGTDPGTPPGVSGTRLFGVDFNRHDALGSPSQ